jgi:hypothetical protein
MTRRGSSPRRTRSGCKKDDRAAAANDFAHLSKYKRPGDRRHSGSQAGDPSRGMRAGRSWRERHSAATRACRCIMQATPAPCADRPHAHSFELARSFRVHLVGLPASWPVKPCAIADRLQIDEG